MPAQARGCCCSSSSALSETWLTPCACRLRQGLGTTEWGRDTPMGRLLLAHLLVGRAILVRGAVLPPSFDPRRQPQFCWINKDGLPFTMPQWQAEFSRSCVAAYNVHMSPMAARHLTVGVVCDGYPGAPTRQQAADVMGHSLDQQQKSYWLGRQKKSNEVGLPAAPSSLGMPECSDERCAH